MAETATQSRKVRMHVRTEKVLKGLPKHTLEISRDGQVEIITLVNSGDIDKAVIALKGMGFVKNHAKREWEMPFVSAKANTTKCRFGYKCKKLRTHNCPFLHSEEEKYAFAFPQIVEKKIEKRPVTAKV